MNLSLLYYYFIGLTVYEVLEGKKKSGQDTGSIIVTKEVLDVLQCAAIDMLSLFSHLTPYM